MNNQVVLREEPGRLYLDIQLPTTKWIDTIFRLRCAPDLLRLGIYPNAKEFTEAYATYRALKKLGLKDENKETVVIVGDGKTPRVGALVAFMTKNVSVFSIDPLINSFPVERLVCVKEKAEHVDYRFLGGFESLFLVFPHSHAPYEKVLSRIFSFWNKPADIVDFPCCVLYDFKVKPYKEYVDYGVFSVKRTFRLYKEFSIAV